MADLPPMPTPTNPNKPLTEFKTLSFDIYGTLIDWETSIIQQLHPLLTALPSSSPFKNASTNQEARLNLMAHYHKHEAALQSSDPGMRYDQLLKQSYLRLAQELSIDTSNSQVKSDATNFGNSVGDWIAFPDTVSAMQRLATYYKLVPLSNVDRASFDRTLAGPLKGVTFWRRYLAEDIGSYKPDLRNFQYLLEHLDSDDKSEGVRGLKKMRILWSRRVCSMIMCRVRRWGSRVCGLREGVRVWVVGGGLRLCMKGARLAMGGGLGRWGSLRILLRVNGRGRSRGWVCACSLRKRGGVFPTNVRRHSQKLWAGVVVRLEVLQKMSWLRRGDMLTSNCLGISDLSAQRVILGLCMSNLSRIRISTYLLIVLKAFEPALAEITNKSVGRNAH